MQVLLYQCLVTHLIMASHGYAEMQEWPLRAAICMHEGLVPMLMVHRQLSNQAHYVRMTCSVHDNSTRAVVTEPMRRDGTQLAHRSA